MRKLISIMGLAVLGLAFSAAVQAKQFTINYSAFDAVTNIYAVVDQGPIIDLTSLGFVPETETTGNGFMSDTWTGDLQNGSEYTFIFRIEDMTQVEDLGLTALLADITGPYSFTVTSDSWRQANSMFMLYPEDAVEWFLNDGSGFLPVITGIDGGAAWISNIAPPGDSGEFDALYLAVTISDTPIPGAAWLMGSGLVGLMGLRRLRRS